MSYLPIPDILKPKNIIGKTGFGSCNLSELSGHFWFPKGNVEWTGDYQRSFSLVSQSAPISFVTNNNNADITLETESQSGMLFKKNGDIICDIGKTTDNALTIHQNSMISVYSEEQPAIGTGFQAATIDAQAGTGLFTLNILASQKQTLRFTNPKCTASSHVFLNGGNDVILQPARWCLGNIIVQDGGFNFDVYNLDNSALVGTVKIWFFII